MTNVVGRTLPFQKTTDCDEKPVPLMVTAALPAPAGLELGLSVVMTGTANVVSPVPSRAPVCGLPATLLAIVSEPVRTPAASGEKTTLIAQAPPNGSDVPQLFVSVKSPVVVIPEIVIGPAVWFWSVTVRGGLDVPILSGANTEIVGVRETPPTNPVPDSGTTFGLPSPELVMVNVPVLIPGPVGRKVT